MNLKWLPNFLTISRIVGLIAGYLIVIEKTPATAFWAFIIFAILGVTDFLDGYLARKLDAVSNFGKILDPIADKFFVLIILFAYVKLDVLSHWWIWPIFIREVLVTFFRFVMIRYGVVIAADMSGKLKTVFQIAALLFFYILYCNLNFWSIESPSINTLIALSAYVVLGVSIYLTVMSGVIFFQKNLPTLIKKLREDLG